MDARWCDVERRLPMPLCWAGALLVSLLMWVALIASARWFYLVFTQ